MSQGFLSVFAHEDRVLFTEDFSTLIRIAKEIDAEYGGAEEELLYNQQWYNTFVQAFNKKYPGLKCTIQRTNEEWRLHIYFATYQSVKELFTCIACKIPGLLAIGSTTLEMDSVHDKQQYDIELRRIKQKMYIRYSGHESIFLKYDSTQEAVELIYDTSTLENHHSPTFELCAYVALERGIQQHINLIDIAGHISSTTHGQGGSGMQPRR